MLDLPPSFSQVNPKTLELTKAYDFYNTLLKVDYNEFVSAHRDDHGNELIVYITQPEISQDPKNDIRYKEELYVVFAKNDNHIPLVFSRRPDFPEVPHLNAMPLEYPRCLCIYEEPYESLKHNWRSISFIQRIREWLSLTSRGELHQDDQPLEPFMINIEGRLILPSDYSPTKEIFLTKTNDYSGLITIVGSHSPNDLNGFLVCDLILKPQVHHIIRYAPKTLFDLNELLVNFISDVFKPWLRKNLDLLNNSNFENRIVLLLTIPKLRDEQDQNPSLERIGFLIGESLIEVCKILKLVGEAGNQLGWLPFDNFDENDLKEIRVAPLSIYTGFNPQQASVFNGIFDKPETEKKMGLIGCGALGSQLFMNLIRSGYYKWNLIDNDILLPHNLARHTLHSYDVGSSKAEALAFVSNTLLGVNDISWLQENYLTPKDVKVLDESLGEVDILLDVSASIPVARKLSHDITVKSRIVSIFLNPKGTDLVILAEPSDRSIRLSELEASYYKLVIDTERLHSHIAKDSEDVRYSSSCRDLSAIIEQDNISILAGIGSKFIKKIGGMPNSKIGIWSVQESGEIITITEDGEGFLAIKENDWNFKLSESAIKKLAKLRTQKLPKETGGILLGFVDFNDSTTYIIDTIPSPSDSREYPNAYYRGIKGIHEKLENIYNWTYGNITYIGEWHSHPVGCSLNMSDDDKTLFKWIEEHMSPLGYPPLMIILGDNADFKIHNQLI
ncbi:JAB domain-containing protein [Reichenbachiella faecimaris]|uniref:JAB domain-containing protein n=2 Tax=Reichenbachiella faecimaris TaxID=692418 RepID=A0A1W2GI63_REIFA|nr:JAB domain-containing protein [Reichenbachiella faecimaris]